MPISDHPRPVTDPGRWAGTPLADPHWLESASGFPQGGIGDRPPGPDRVVARARGLELRQHQVDDLVAVTELLAATALPDDDRRGLAAEVVEAFDDAPASTLRSLIPVTSGLAHFGTRSPAGRSVDRHRMVTAAFSVELARVADGEGLSPLLETVHAHNPIVRSWMASGLVVLADAVEARVDQHRLTLALVGRSLDDPEGLWDRLLDEADSGGPLVAGELAAATVRLIVLRCWLLDLGRRALDRTRIELEAAIRSALDVDVVVQQLAHRAAMAVAGREALVAGPPTETGSAGAVGPVGAGGRTVT